MTVDDRPPISDTDLAQINIDAVASVLRQWRAAERDLAELTPGSKEYARMFTEVELLRERYHELVKSAKPQD